MRPLLPHTQRGSVIVLTLWTVTLLTILITVMASQIRLSAQAAMLHQDDLTQWSALSSAMSQAEMELVLARMPVATAGLEVSQLGRTLDYRFNGDALQLNYPQAQDVVVRIYDHAGKINIRELGTPRLRELLSKQLGDEATSERLGALISAWIDWTDLNDAASPEGAEADYYLSLDPPYRPRNGAIESVDEILLIKGFDEVFGDVDLDAAFTIYGDSELLNLNLATVEAMQLLPGLDAELIQQIVDYRRENEFRGNGDIAQLVPAESMAVLRNWSNLRRTTSGFFTIVVYPRSEEAQETDDGLVLVDTATTGLGEIVQVAASNTRPRVYKINPYQRIPIRLLPSTEE